MTGTTGPENPYQDMSFGDLLHEQARRYREGFPDDPTSGDDPMPALGVPVDPTGWSFVALTAAEAVVDNETNQPAADGDGRPLFSIQLAAFGDHGADVVAVRFPGPPAAGVKQGAAVEVTSLVAYPWERDGWGGIPFAAAGVEAANGDGPKGSAA